MGKSNLINMEYAKNRIAEYTQCLNECQHDDGFFLGYWLGRVVSWLDVYKCNSNNELFETLTKHGVFMTSNSNQSCYVYNRRVYTITFYDDDRIGIKDIDIIF